MKKSSTVNGDDPTAQVSRIAGAGTQAHLEKARLAVPSDPLSDPLIEQIGALFAVLTNGTRLKLLFALHPRLQSDEVQTARELCVCDLAAMAGASMSLTSHQLHLLRRARLVEFRRCGKHALYRLSDGPHAHLLLDALEHARTAMLAATLTITGATSHGSLGAHE